MKRMRGCCGLRTSDRSAWGWLREVVDASDVQIDMEEDADTDDDDVETVGWLLYYICILHI